MYAKLMPQAIQHLAPKQFCEAILIALELDRTQFALGVKRVFFKAGQRAFLEQLTGRDLSEGGLDIVAKVCVFSLYLSISLFLFSLSLSLSRLPCLLLCSSSPSSLGSCLYPMRLIMISRIGGCRELVFVSLPYATHHGIIGLY